MVKLASFNGAVIFGTCILTWYLFKCMMRLVNLPADELFILIFIVRDLMFTVMPFKIELTLSFTS